MGLLDISGFFTGLIINLLLITLVCYYFKRKYENIEAAQMEQAKVLYELLKKQPLDCGENICERKMVREKESDWETDEDDEDDEDEEDEEDEEGECIENKKEQDSHHSTEKVLTLDLEHPTDYNKMSVRTLRDLLTNKGVKTNNKMKKNELIRLVTDKKSLVVDLAFEPEEGADSVEVTEEVVIPIDHLD